MSSGVFTVASSNGAASLYEALSLAQGLMKNPEKTKTATIRMKAEKGGGSYSYKYADLPAVIDAIREPFAKNGLSHRAEFRSIEGQSELELIVSISHSSGGEISSRIVIPGAGSDPKGFAANMTYFRRYLLCGLAGIAADDDTDGEPESASEPVKKLKMDAFE